MTETTPPSSLNLAYVVVFVPVVAQAVAFYGRAFGLKPRMVTDAFAQLDTGTVALAFGAEFNERSELPSGFEFHENRTSSPASGVQVSLTSEDVQQAFDHAVAAQPPSRAPQPPRHTSWGFLHWSQEQTMPSSRTAQ